MQQRPAVMARSNSVLSERAEHTAYVWSGRRRSQKIRSKIVGRREHTLFNLQKRLTKKIARHRTPRQWIPRLSQDASIPLTLPHPCKLSRASRVKTREERGRRSRSANAWRIKTRGGRRMTGRPLLPGTKLACSWACGGRRCTGREQSDVRRENKKAREMREKKK